MGILRVSRRKSRSPQIGDLRDRVVLFERDIQAPSFGTASFTQLYTQLAEVWSRVETVEGPQLFTGVDTSVVITHIFTIRYRDDITAETVITFDSQNYKIVDPDDADKRHRFLFLKCVLQGDDDKQANR